MFLAAVLAFSLLPAAFAADSGNCGDNVTWSYDNHVLTIEGTGPMSDCTYELYDNATGQPWSDWEGNIDTVIIADGVTSIGARAVVRA